jgi:serine/threonine protein phosphatase PrpC
MGALTKGRLVVRVALRTDVGKVRSENQDYATFTRPDEEVGREPGGRLMLVADGMGGHRGGATASRLAGETIKEHYLHTTAEDIPTALQEALRAANAKIWAEAQTNQDLRGMGTTTSALVVKSNTGWFAHVGDSRIYMVRGDHIRQLTDDHSLVATMVREGLLTSQEAENHPRRNVLQRSMGVGEDVDIDIRGPLPLQEGDTFVLCSDGLHGLVKEEELREVAKLPIDEAADEFVKRALDRGAPDNVTVIVARVEAEPEPKDDRLLFEETVREKPSPGPSAHPLPQAGEGTTTQGPLPLAGEGGRRPGEGRAVTTSVVKWALLFMAVLGAAGAWLFWTQQQSLGNRPTQSSQR